MAVYFKEIVLYCNLVIVIVDFSFSLQWLLYYIPHSARLFTKYTYITQTV